MIKAFAQGCQAEGKVLVAVAVEQAQPKGFGRCRLKVIPNAQSSTLWSFLLNHVEPGSTLITDGLSSYRGAAGSDYAHHPTPVKGSGKKAHELLPGAH
jgi:transposase-like protein